MKRSYIDLAIVLISSIFLENTSCSCIFSFITALEANSYSRKSFWKHISLSFLVIAWRSQDALTAGPPSWA